MAEYSPRAPYAVNEYITEPPLQSSRSGHHVISPFGGWVPSVPEWEVFGKANISTLASKRVGSSRYGEPPRDDARYTTTALVASEHARRAAEQRTSRMPPPSLDKHCERPRAGASPPARRSSTAPSILAERSEQQTTTPDDGPLDTARTVVAEEELVPLTGGGFMTFIGENASTSPATSTPTVTALCSTAAFGYAGHRPGDKDIIGRSYASLSRREHSADTRLRGHTPRTTAAGANLTMDERRRLSERAAADAKAATRAANAQIELARAAATGRHLSSTRGHGHPELSPRSATFRGSAMSPRVAHGQSTMQNPRSGSPSSARQRLSRVRLGLETEMPSTSHHSPGGNGGSASSGASSPDQATGASPRALGGWTLTADKVAFGSTSSTTPEAVSPLAAQAHAQAAAAVSLVEQGRSGARLPSTKMQTYVVFVPQEDGASVIA